MTQSSGSDSAIVPALRRQYGAAIEMLRRAIQDCPDELWDARDDENPFWQKAYHTIYYIDLYLSNPPGTFESPSFHTPDSQTFAKSPSKPFSREQIEGYLEKAAAKCAEVFDGLTLEGLGQECGSRRHATIGDILIYNLRHVQHHVGAMYHYLRRKTGGAPDWLAYAE